MKKTEIETLISSNPTTVFAHNHHDDLFVIDSVKHYITRYGTSTYKAQARRVVWTFEHGVVYGSEMEIALTSIANFVVFNTIEEFATAREKAREQTVARADAINRKVEQIAAMRADVEEALAQLGIVNIKKRYDQTGHTYKIELEPDSVAKLLDMLNNTHNDVKPA